VTESPDMTRRLRAWSYLHQRLGRAASESAKALRDVVAVYSSHPTAPLSLSSRSKSFGAGRLSEMEQRREVLRIPAMRQSIFLVPAETAPRIFAATRLPKEKHARRLRYADLDWDGYARLKQRVLEYTQTPIAASPLRKALPADESLMMGVRVMASEGLVLRLGASLRADNLRYVATEAWLGHPLEEADPQQSLKWLAEEYMRAYGPARVEDFAWWSGVSRRTASSALGEARVVDIGDGLLLPSDQRAAFERIEPLGPEIVDLLPKWDSYTMGHAPDGRQRLVDDEHVGSAYATSGDGLPLVLRGGRAVATWSHRFASNLMRVRVIPFERGTFPSELYERTFDEVGRLMGATDVEVIAGTG
jgi:winged helix DNA-binding protein